MKQIKLIIVYMGIFFVFSQVTQAQYLLKLSDKDCVELSLDMIRKGVQQEDTVKVIKILGANIKVQGNEVKSKSIITQTFTQIFANSSQRINFLGNKTLSTSNNRLKDSNLWDFDILSPKITIKDDSAFVDCELVLWSANSKKANSIGSKITERLVFFSPYHGQTSKTSSNNPLRWKLVESNKMFYFLENYGTKSVQVDSKGGEQK